MAAFSKRDQAHITTALDPKRGPGNWQGTRAGTQVRFERAAGNLTEPELRQHIEFHFRLKGHPFVERADTVAHAIEFLNRALRHRRFAKDRSAKEGHLQ